MFFFGFGLCSITCTIDPRIHDAWFRNSHDVNSETILFLFAPMYEKFSTFPYKIISSLHRVGRVLSLFSSRRNWDSPNPSPAGECPPGSRGRGTLAGERVVGKVPIPTRGRSLWCSLYIHTSTLCASLISRTSGLYSHIWYYQFTTILTFIKYSFICLSRFIVFVRIYALHTYFIGMKLTTCPLLPFWPNFYPSHITPFIQPLQYIILKYQLNIKSNFYIPYLLYKRPWRNTKNVVT